MKTVIIDQNPQFSMYATPPHECSYLPEREATTVFIDPLFRKNSKIYSTLSQHGFRRSGEHLYRPQCHSCSACIPVRLPVASFTPRRNQQRTWKKNQDLQVTPTKATFKQEHFELYQYYLASRHQGGGMDHPSPESFVHFLTSSWSRTIFYEFRLQEQLVAVAVADFFDHGLSAVYTFFNPDYAERSLGVFAILWEIEEAKRLGKTWVYLGYWIKECHKMNYKTQYQPLEYYRQGNWHKDLPSGSASA
jgi:arginine-tRNA-protein transferase